MGSESVESEASCRAITESSEGDRPVASQYEESAAFSLEGYILACYDYHCLVANSGRFELIG